MRITLLNTKFIFSKWFTLEVDYWIGPKQDIHEFNKLRLVNDL